MAHQRLTFFLPHQTTTTTDLLAQPNHSNNNNNNTATIAALSFKWFNRVISSTTYPHAYIKTAHCTVLLMPISLLPKNEDGKARRTLHLSTQTIYNPHSVWFTQNKIKKIQQHLLFFTQFDHASNNIWFHAQWVIWFGGFCLSIWMGCLT